jgi:hypothetical protein
MKAALINNTGCVANVIVWDKTCTAPNGVVAVVIEDDVAVAPGWTYVDSVFIAPEQEPTPAPEPPPVLTTEQKLEAAGLTVAELRELFGLPEPELS